MVHTWKGQTKEEFMREVARDRGLTPEQRKREWDECIKKMDETTNNFRQIGKTPQKEESKSSKMSNAERMYVYTESPHSLSDGVVTIYWVIAMVVGTLFNDRILVYVLATTIWLSHIFRHKIRHWQWHHGKEEEYYKKMNEIGKGGN